MKLREYKYLLMHVGCIEYVTDVTLL